MSKIISLQSGFGNIFFQLIPALRLSTKILHATAVTFTWWSVNASFSNEIYMSSHLKSKLVFYNSKIKKL